LIRSLHKLLRPASDADYSALMDFFDSLGLARGDAWEGRRSKGVKLHAPEAGVEIGMGSGFPDADLVMEVDNADAVYEVMRPRGVIISEEIADHDWGARMFTVELPAGSGRLAVFSYLEPREDGLAGKLNASGRRFGVVVARFNAFVTERLLAAALDALRRCGTNKEDVEVVRVPGAFEIPAAARMLASGGRIDAVICLGCIIRGQTSHYEHLANEVTRGIGQSAQDTAVPHALGVLTCDNLEQAIDRAGLKSGNKGFEAALSAVEMASLRQTLEHDAAIAQSALVGQPQGRGGKKQNKFSASRNNSSKKRSSAKASPPRRSR
jgi:6,7-dimethyl-8-ribityllumazine synthase